MGQMSYGYPSHIGNPEHHGYINLYEICADHFPFETRRVVIMACCRLLWLGVPTTAMLKRFLFRSVQPPRSSLASWQMALSSWVEVESP